MQRMFTSIITISGPYSYIVLHHHTNRTFGLVSTVTRGAILPWHPRVGAVPAAATALQWWRQSACTKPLQEVLHAKVVGGLAGGQAAGSGRREGGLAIWP